MDPIITIENNHNIVVFRLLAVALADGIPARTLFGPTLESCTLASLACVHGFHAVLAELQQEPYRVMVILASCLGLSRSELTGLQWSDFDWKGETLTIRRSVVNNRVGNPKTQARSKPVPLAPELIRVLRQ